MHWHFLYAFHRPWLCPVSHFPLETASRLQAPVAMMLTGLHCQVSRTLYLPKGWILVTFVNLSTFLSFLFFLIFVISFCVILHSPRIIHCPHALSDYWSYVSLPTVIFIVLSIPLFSVNFFFYCSSWVGCIRWSPGRTTRTLTKPGHMA